MQKNNYTIMLSGGGSLGSVTPLLALFEYSKNHSEHEHRFIWVGTKNGVERKFVQSSGLKYYGILSGKLRRYFSVKNITDIFKIIGGFFQSVLILYKERPDVLVVSGSFVSVPLAYACAFLRIPVIVHHMDIEVGLANKLMSYIAHTVNVTFEINKKDFRNKKCLQLGNPIRESILSTEDKKTLLEKFNLDENKKTLLVLGGGLGSRDVNTLIQNSCKDLSKEYNIIHITGKGKSIKPCFKNHFVCEFVKDEMAHMYAVSDIILTRGGFATICELLYLQKPMIIFPLIGQQVKNAEFFESKNVARVYNPDENLVSQLNNILENTSELTQMHLDMQKLFKKDAAHKLLEYIHKTY